MNISKKMVLSFGLLFMPNITLSTEVSIHHGVLFMTSMNEFTIKDIEISGRHGVLVIPGLKKSIVIPIRTIDRAIVALAILGGLYIILTYNTKKQEPKADNQKQTDQAQQA